MKTIYWYGLLAIALGCASCSGETETLRLIDNRSSKNIKVLPFRFGATYGDTIRLEAGKTHQMSKSTTDRAQENPDDCAPRIDSAQWWVEGGGIITKKLQSPAQWEAETEQTGSFPSKFKHKCTFIIRNADII